MFTSRIIPVASRTLPCRVASKIFGRVQIRMIMEPAGQQIAYKPQRQPPQYIPPEDLEAERAEKLQRRMRSSRPQRQPQYIPTEDLEAERAAKQQRRLGSSRPRREPQYIPTEDLEAERAAKDQHRMKSPDRLRREPQYIPQEDLEAEKEARQKQLETSSKRLWEPEPHMKNEEPRDWSVVEKKIREEEARQYLKDSKDMLLGDEHHFVPIDEQHLPQKEEEIPRDWSVVEKKIKEEEGRQFLKNSKDMVIGDEHHFVPLDETHLPHHQKAKKSSMGGENEEVPIPHVTFPINYPTVEQIDSIVKAKEDKLAEKKKEDEIRHHAWE